MIHLKFPKANPLDKFESIYSSHGKISEYKFWEFEFYCYDWYWVEFQFEWIINGFDHAGLEIGIGILGYYINFKIYDSRHWNKELNSWNE